jgi:hypothetical protein
MTRIALPSGSGAAPKPRPVKLPSSIYSGPLRVGAAPPTTTKQNYGVAAPPPVLKRAAAGKPVTPKMQAKVKQFNTKVAKARAPVAKAIAPPKHKSSGLLGISAIQPPSIHLGSIHVPRFLDAAGHEIGKIAVNTGKDLAALPKTSAIGLEGLGKATVETVEQRIEHPLRNTSPTGDFFTSTPLGQQAKVMWDTSPEKELATGHIGDFGRSLEAHPLNTTLEMTPLGKFATIGGDVARTGALGEKAADYASTAREGRELAPGAGTSVQHYSRNLVTNRLQKAADRAPEGRLARTRDTVQNARPNAELGKTLLRIKRAKEVKSRSDAVARLGKSRYLNRINESVDHFWNTHRVRDIAAREEIHGKVHPHLNDLDEREKGIFGLVADGAIGTPERAVPVLEHLERSWKATLARYRAGGKDARDITPESAHQIEVNLHAVQRQLKRTDFDKSIRKVFKVKDATVPHAREVENKLGDEEGLGVLPSSQMEKRRLLPYAQQEMGAFHLTKKDGVKTPAALAHAEAKADVKAALKNRKITGTAVLKGLNTKYAYTPEIRQTVRQLHSAEKGEQKMIGQLSHTSHSVTGPALTPKDYNRVIKVMDKSDDIRGALSVARRNFENDFRDARQRRFEDDQAAKEMHQDARKREVMLRPYRNNNYEGWMHHDPVTGETRPLTTEAIKKHMAQNGVSPTMYVRATNPYTEERALGAMGRDGLGARGDNPGHRFTGTSHERGAFDISAEGVSNSLDRQMRRLEQAKTHDLMGRRYALDDAKEYPPEEAIDRKREWEAAHPGLKLQMVNAHTRNATDEQLAAQSRNLGQESDPMDQMLHAENENRLFGNDMTADDIKARDPDARVWLIPKQVTDRIALHRKEDERTSVMRAANRLFRNAVLPTSTKWLLGNTAEAQLRLMLKGAGPMDYKLARDFLKSFPPDERSDFLANLGNGLHFGSQERLNVESLSAKSGDQAAIQAQVIDRNWTHIHHYYSNYRKMIFNANRKLEDQYEMTALGQHLHETLRELKQSGILDDMQKTMDKQEAYMQALKDRVASPEGAEEAAHYIHDALGKYNSFSPATKRYLATAAPFGAWYLAAMKFIYYTVPKEHPLAQAALAAEGAHNAAYVNANQPYGVKEFGTKFGDLTTALQEGPDKYLPVTHFLPYSAFTENGPSGWGTSQLGPGFTSGMMALEGGENPFGEPLRGPGGETVSPQSSQAVQSALNDWLGSFVPLTSLAERAKAGGATEYSTSTLWNTQTKPGQKTSARGALNKILNPLRPTNLDPTGGSVTGDTSGGAFTPSGTTGGAFTPSSAPGAFTPGGG